MKDNTETGDPIHPSDTIIVAVIWPLGSRIERHSTVYTGSIPLNLPSSHVTIKAFNKLLSNISK